MRRVHVDFDLSVCVYPTIVIPIAGKDESMDTIIIDYGKPNLLQARH